MRDLEPTSGPWQDWLELSSPQEIAEIHALTSSPSLLYRHLEDFLHQIVVTFFRPTHYRLGLAPDLNKLQEEVLEFLDELEATKFWQHLKDLQKTNPELPLKFLLARSYWRFKHPVLILEDSAFSDAVDRVFGGLLSGLPEQEQLCTLLYFDGLTPNEIGALLELDPPTVSALVRSSKSYLKGTGS